jgi:hypothetical protein
MDALRLGYHQLGHHYGYLIDKAPQNVLKELEQQINNLQSDFSKGVKYNDNLAGQIQHEYSLVTQSQTKQYIQDLTQSIENKSNYLNVNYGYPLSLEADKLWVNFQKKYEYNPIHEHKGLYSYVIWYQIPYTFENEIKYHYNSDNDKCKHGRFSFITPLTFSRSYNIDHIILDIDQTKEGYVAIFPSNLSHMVYPFYSSDGYRITVAGNVESSE